MRGMSGWVVGCVAVASGCATTTTSVVGTQVTRVEPYTVPAPSRESLTARRDGLMLTVRVMREQATRSMRRVTGYEQLAITSEVPTWVTGVAIGGAIAAGAGLLLAVPLRAEMSGSGADPGILGSQPVVGGVLLGVGTVAVLPWLFSGSGTTSSSRPFFRDEIDPGAPSGPALPSPLAGASVELWHSGVTVATERTDAQGEVSFDLAQALPASAILGAAPWGEILVRTASGAVMRHGLQDLPRLVADRAWAELRASPTENAAAVFRQRFPRDARCAMLDRLVAEARPPARDPYTGLPESAVAPSPPTSENSRDWVGLDLDPQALAVFAAREPVDVYVAEARCRLAAQERDPALRRYTLERCRGALVALPSASNTVEDAVLARAAQERDTATAASEAFDNERTTPADDIPVRRGARRDDGDRATSLEGRLRSAIDRCGDGSPSMSDARRAYGILAAMRAQVDGARFRALRTQIDVTCHSSSGAAGVSLP